VDFRDILDGVDEKRERASGVSLPCSRPVRRLASRICKLLVNSVFDI